MSPYMSEKKNKIPLYRLYAVVVHVDMLNASFFGHYICYVKDSKGLWYKIDDNKVFFTFLKNFCIFIHIFEFQYNFFHIINFSLLLKNE